MNSIFDDLKSVMALRGISVDTLAAKLFKEPGSIKKQLNPLTANPQLSTLLQYAAALDAQLRVLPIDSEDDDIEAYRNRLALLQQDREQILAESAHLREIIEQQNITIETQAQRIEECDKLLAELQDQVNSRARYLGKIYDSLEEETKDNRILRAENKELLNKLMKLKGVEL